MHGTDDDVAGTAGRHGLTFAALLQRLEREFAGLAEETTLSLGKCISATVFALEKRGGRGIKRSWIDRSLM